jgi:hypothetical protein
MFLALMALLHDAAACEGDKLREVVVRTAWFTMVRYVDYGTIDSTGSLLNGQ